MANSLLLDFCQRGQFFLRRIPQLVMTSAQLLQIRILEPPRLMYPMGELVEIIAVPAQQGHQLPLL